VGETRSKGEKIVNIMESLYRFISLSVYVYIQIYIYTYYSCLAIQIIIKPMNSHAYRIISPVKHFSVLLANTKVSENY